MKIAISIGDLNGVGVEIALRSHSQIKEFCNPIYLIDDSMLDQACKLLKIERPKDFHTKNIGEDFTITPSRSTKESGYYSYLSFIKACDLADDSKADGVVTLPINKLSWQKAGIDFKGHTDLLASRYNKDAIMMIGSPKLFTALFTHHIPLRDVPSSVKLEPLKKFLTTLYSEIKEEKIGVLGLNPHAGDGGVMGDEESIITEAISQTNKELLEDVFVGPLVPDTAFTPHMLEKFSYFVCIYHDQGLIATKALHFEDGINVSLNLPIIRTSVDHGTAFDIAYKDKNPSTLSYINAVKEAVRLIDKRSSYTI